MIKQQSLISLIPFFLICFLGQNGTAQIAPLDSTQLLDTQLYESIEDAVAQKGNVYRLFIRHYICKHTTFPKEILSMTKLQVLDFSRVRNDRNDNSTPCILSKIPEEISKLELLEYLTLEGRSLINNQPFIRGSIDVAIGYWTSIERRYLQEMLVLLFGTWDELQSASQKSSDAEMKFYGIQCVLQMLQDAEGKDGDVIISID